MITFLYFFAAFFLLLYAIFLVVPGFYFYKRPKKDHGEINTTNFISIVIPVRNEEKNIAPLLESLSELNYPKENSEIILIDDHSTDRTKNIAEQFGRLIPNLKIISAREDQQGKKQAITAGIEVAKGNIIAATDGDCVVPQEWLSEIARAFSDPEIIFAAGPVAYKNKPSLLRDFLEIEQVSLQIISGGAIKMNKPLMCNGANLAYTKDFFEKNGGFANDKFISGDDMMLLQKAERSGKRKIRYMDSQNVIVRTNSAVTISEALAQRMRWASKFSAYKTSFTGVAGITVFTVNFMLLVIAAICLWENAAFPVLVSAFLTKMLIDLLLLSLAVPFFREPRLFLLAPAGGFFYPFLAVISTLASFTGSFRWKGRKWKFRH